MRADVEGILGRLLGNREHTISLDTIGEAVGAAAITQDEIAQILDRLEAAGKEIGSPSSKLRQQLLPVLTQARRIKHERQDTPNVSAIAEATGLTVAEVRAALLYASVMGR